MRKIELPYGLIGIILVIIAATSEPVIGEFAHHFLFIVVGGFIGYGIKQ